MHVSPGFDHLRSGLELYGLIQRVVNTSFEGDTPNPAPTTAIGYTPADWTVTNALAAGGGARNLYFGGNVGGSDHQIYQEFRPIWQITRWS